MTWILSFAQHKIHTTFPLQLPFHTSPVSICKQLKKLSSLKRYWLAEEDNSQMYLESRRNVFLLYRILTRVYTFKSIPAAPEIFIASDSFLKGHISIMLIFYRNIYKVVSHAGILRSATCKIKQNTIWIIDRF